MGLIDPESLAANSEQVPATTMPKAIPLAVATGSGTMAAAEAPVRRPLLEASVDSFRGWLVEQGIPGYRARQVFDWVFRRRAESFEVMNNLPKELRRRLAESWTVFGTAVAYHGVSPDGTDKLLLSCRDGRRLECVLMAESDRRTVCLSTQVGCGMGCVFCASGLKGVERNLTSGEILEQAIRLRNLLPANESLTNIVVMGMGESLANLDNLVAALDRLCSPEGLGLSPRRVTISTVGLPEKIHKLASLDRSYHLAVSLHAPTEALRNELVPVNASIGLGAVVEAADAYFEQTGRQVTYEYVLLHGVNDRPEDATALGRLLRSRKSHVNLIPYNPVEGLPFERPHPEAIEGFVSALRSWGVSATVRRTKGQAIDAACGQLRRRVERDEAERTRGIGGAARSPRSRGRIAIAARGPRQEPARDPLEADEPARLPKPKVARPSLSKVAAGRRRSKPAPTGGQAGPMRAGKGRRPR
jgi:23S rRNA (adenine2503-C2)-methyltransferase